MSLQAAAQMQNMCFGMLAMMQGRPEAEVRRYMGASGLPQTQAPNTAAPNASAGSTVADTTTTPVGPPLSGGGRTPYTGVPTRLAMTPLVPHSAHMVHGMAGQSPGNVPARPPSSHPTT